MRKALPFEKDLIGELAAEPEFTASCRKPDWMSPMPGKTENMTIAAMTEPIHGEIWYRLCRVVSNGLLHRQEEPPDAGTWMLALDPADLFIDPVDLFVCHGC
jgi:hypothetical protein